MAKLSFSAALELAQSYLQAGYWSQAETVCRALAAAEPMNPWVENLRGAALQGLGELLQAEAAYRRVAALAPELAVGHYNLAVVLEAQGRGSEARLSYEAAVAADSRHPGAWNNLGLLRHAAGDHDGAAEALEHALQWRPKDPTFRANLAAVRLAQGRLGDAEQQVRAALVQAPGDPSLWNTLGVILRRANRPQPAEAALRQALALHPDFAPAANNLGSLLLAAGRAAEAQAVLEQAVAAAPNHLEAWTNLAAALLVRRRYAEAEAACDRARAVDPDHANVHNTLGAILLAQGEVAAADEAFDAAVRRAPDAAAHHSNRLLCRQYRPGVTAEELARLHAEWDRRHAARLPAAAEEAAGGPGGRAGEAQRIGFVSSGLRQHPVGLMLAPLLEALAGLGCQTVCYGDLSAADAVTERIRRAAARSVDTAGLGDETMAARIRDDRIDLLVDLDGHTTANRLLVFARRPAAVQVTWFGYPGTTGLGAMDGLVADRWHVTAEEEPHYRERVLRLPQSYACYEPPSDAPPVSPLPADRRGAVTLGCFNNPAKVGDEVLATWAEVLRRVPRARLILAYGGYDAPRARRRIAAALESAGVSADRVELRGWRPRRQVLEEYAEIDLALDPWPYSGGVTTCEALWMGVPVLARPGATFAGRHSVSYLQTVGLAELVAADREAYVQRAVELAEDAAPLRRLRGELRPRMAASPLCDVPRFARDWLELLGRAGWGTACSRP